MRTLAALILLLGLAERTLAAATCTVAVSASTLAFGNYTPTDPLASMRTLGDVSISCSRPLLDPDTVVNYSVVIGAGTSGNFSVRTMVAGSERLSYTLFQDAAGQARWGASGRTGSISLPWASAWTKTERLPVFGQISPLQNVAPGAYADPLLVTVTYD